MLRELLTAGIYYMPFVIVIGFACFVFLLGLLCLFSGTLFVFLFAAYGVYCFLHTSGILTKIGGFLKHVFSYADTSVVENIKASFVLKNSEKIPNRNALYICSPHGIVGYAWSLHFSYCLSHWSSTQPRPLFAIHSIFFKFPFVRELFLANRCIEASETEIRKALESGESVAILLGGVEEMTLTNEESVRLIMKKRKGYARLAKETGVPIVPLYTMGENELFTVEKGYVWRVFSSLMYKATGLQFPLPSWTSMKNFAKILEKPLEPPIQTFVLNPIDTQNKEEKTIRKECVSRLQTFFKEQNIQAEIIA